MGLTNAINLERTFAKDQTVVSVEAHINKRLGRYQCDVVLLDRLELAVHEETDIVHKEDDLVGASNLEEGVFSLKRTPCQAEVAFNIVGLILFFVGADHVGAVKAHV